MQTSNLEHNLNFDSSFYEREDCLPPSGLLESHSGAFYFAKDLNGRFVYANQKLIEFFNLNSSRDIIGKTDYDLNPVDLADAFVKDDLRVVKENTFLSNKIELIKNGQDAKEWFSTTKGPLYNRKGDIVGIEGIAFSTAKAIEMSAPVSDLSNCLEFIQSKYQNPILMKEIANQFHMSISTFEKKFKHQFNISPKQYLKRLRIQKACEMLRTHHSVKEVTYSTGFCDQSYFTKEFRVVMGMTPNAYRKSFKHTTPHLFNFDDLPTAAQAT